MVINCENCGYWINEVKFGGVVEFLGIRIIFYIIDFLDMIRDFFKFEICSVEILELEFELGMVVFGGKFIILEGLLKDI